jgi:hypothetical protein
MEVDDNLWIPFFLLEATQQLYNISCSINQRDEFASYYCISECVEHVKTTLALELLYSTELKQCSSTVSVHQPTRFIWAFKWQRSSSCLDWITKS